MDILYCWLQVVQLPHWANSNAADSLRFKTDFLLLYKQQKEISVTYFPIDLSEDESLLNIEWFTKMAFLTRRVFRRVFLNGVSVLVVCKWAGSTQQSGPVIALSA